MIHVLAFTLHRVLERMASSLAPAPVLDDSTAVRQLMQAGEKGKKGKKEASTTSALVRVGTAAAEAGQRKSASQEVSEALEAVVPDIMEVIMDDVVGERAKARQSDTYVSRSRAMEARVCKSYNTYELLARCIPFLPSPAIHSVRVAPLSGGPRAGSIHMHMTLVVWVADLGTAHRTP